MNRHSIKSVKDIRTPDKIFKHLKLSEKSKILVVRYEKGLFMDNLLKTNYTISIADNRMKVIQQLKKTYKDLIGNGKVNLKLLKTTNLPYKSNHFDLVIANTLRFYDSPQSILNEIKKVLKKQGIFILYEMSFPSQLQLLFESLSYFLRNGEHAYYWNYNEIIKMLRETGFHIQMIIPSEYISDNLTRHIRDTSTRNNIDRIISNLDLNNKSLLRFKNFQKRYILHYETYDILCTK